MTSPVIEAMALAMINSDREAGGWPKVGDRDTIPNSDGYVRCAIDALKALEENITDEMLEAANHADALSESGDHYRDIFTAMLRAAREE